MLNIEYKNEGRGYKSEHSGLYRQYRSRNTNIEEA